MSKVTLRAFAGGVPSAVFIQPSGTAGNTRVAPYAELTVQHTVSTIHTQVLSSVAVKERVLLGYVAPAGTLGAEEIEAIATREVEEVKVDYLALVNAMLFEE